MFFLESLLQFLESLLAVPVLLNFMSSGLLCREAEGSEQLETIQNASVGLPIGSE